MEAADYCWVKRFCQEQKIFYCHRAPVRKRKHRAPLPALSARNVGEASTKRASEEFPRVSWSSRRSQIVNLSLSRGAAEEQCGRRRQPKIKPRRREGRKGNHQDTKAPRTGKGIRIQKRPLLLGTCSELGPYEIFLKSCRAKGNVRLLRY